MKTFVGWLTSIGEKSTFTFRAGEHALAVTQPPGVKLNLGEAYKVLYEPPKGDPTRYHATMHAVHTVTGQQVWTEL